MLPILLQHDLHSPPVGSINYLPERGLIVKLKRPLHVKLEDIQKIFGNAGFRVNFGTEIDNSRYVNEFTILEWSIDPWLLIDLTTKSSEN